MLASTGAAQRLCLVAAVLIIMSVDLASNVLCRARTANDKMCILFAGRLSTMSRVEGHFLSSACGHQAGESGISILNNFE
jgi:hypothetical protein